MQVRTKSVSSMLRMRSVWRNSSPTSQSVALLALKIQSGFPKVQYKNLRSRQGRPPPAKVPGEKSLLQPPICHQMVKDGSFGKRKRIGGELDQPRFKESRTGKPCLGRNRIRCSHRFSHFCARFLCMSSLCQVRADTNLVYS